MGKRSDFKRRRNDAYQTIDAKAVTPLMPYLWNIDTFAEPCCGEGRLVAHIEQLGPACVYLGDIIDGRDAMDWHAPENPDAIITNPPWTRAILHPMIRHFQNLAPTWLLFDADWAHTKQANPFLDQCSHIVSVGRVKWIADTPHTGKDNCAWYRFDCDHSGGPRFVGQQLQVAA